MGLTMDLDDTLPDVLEVARAHAREVDLDGRFPAEAVSALRQSGLLGLTLPEEVGGLGGGPQELVTVLTSLAGACGSTAMIYLMHISAAMPIAAAPPPGLPKLLHQLADGSMLGSLAFSEAASRSHFWAPVSRAHSDGQAVSIRAKKSWVTSAGEADVYVISTLSAPDDADEGSVDLFVVPADTAGLKVASPWRGMGLRGNASSPMSIEVDVPADFRVGDPGSGFGAMLQVVMPWFNLGNSSVSLGLAGAAVEAAIQHCTASRLEHLDQSLAALPTIRAQLAKMAIDLAMARAYLDLAADRVSDPQDETPLFVLGVKAAANDTALRVTDAAMRVCGGAAFSEHNKVARYFKDARAGAVMAPTADVLYDFYGKAITGQPLF